MENKVVEIYYNKELLIVQANELVRSRQEDLTLLEAKIIRLAISQVLKDDKDLKTYTCNVVDLANFLKISQDNIYRDIQELSQDIMKKSIFIKSKDNKKGYKIFHWIDYIEYKDGVITFKLSESLKPYLIGLQELFTTYEYDTIISLPTNNAIRLYELLASYQNIQFQKVIDHSFFNIKLGKNEFLFTIDWLREYFNCENKYRNTGDFIKRIIAPSVEAIQKNTLMRIDYKLIKEKRSIKAIIFSLKSWITDSGEAERILNRISRENEEKQRYIINE